MNALPSGPVRRHALGVGDVDAVLAVERLAYSHPWSRGNFLDSLAAGYLAELVEDEAAAVVAYFVAMPMLDELHLLNITVAPAWQGQGYGRALLDVVQAHGKARSCTSLWLEVRHSNERARALYRRRGFAEVGLRRDYYPAAIGREAAVVMSLPLLGPGPAPPVGASP